MGAIFAFSRKGDKLYCCDLRRLYEPKIALSVEVTNWPQRVDPITAVQLLDNLVIVKVTDFLFIFYISYSFAVLLICKSPREADFVEH